MGMMCLGEAVGGRRGCQLSWCALGVGVVSRWDVKVAGDVPRRQDPRNFAGRIEVGPDSRQILARQADAKPDLPRNLDSPPKSALHATGRKIIEFCFDCFAPQSRPGPSFTHLPTRCRA
jgi:hypothetical protein